MRADFDVVIIGGGAAGIGAARQLAQSTLSTVLLEADSRLGGRAWTAEVSGQHLDLGCEWFHSGDRNSWVGIAEAAGLTIDRSAAKWGTQFRDLGFSKAERAAAGDEFSEWMRRLETLSPRSDCAADALNPKGEWNDYIRTVVSFISGASLEQLSVADYLAYDEASTEFNWRAPAGYGSLVAGSCPREIVRHLSTPVEEISLDAAGVSISTASGVIRARAAILTVSTSVLADESFRLPAELAPWREAARHLPLGRNEKLFLEVTGAGFEPETQLLGNPRDQRTGSYYIRPLGSSVIGGFFGGEGARFVEESGSEAGFEFAIDQLSALLGSNIRSKLRPLVASRWSAMKHIGGAYSYALPGHAAARKALARPFDTRLFFAGEATSAGDFSTAHGAYDSGVRAAAEVSAALTSAEAAKP